MTRKKAPHNVLRTEKKKPRRGAGCERAKKSHHCNGDASQGDCGWCTSANHGLTAAKSSRRVFRLSFHDYKPIIWRFCAILLNTADPRRDIRPDFNIQIWKICSSPRLTVADRAKHISPKAGHQSRAPPCLVKVMLDQTDRS